MTTAPQIAPPVHHWVKYSVVDVDVIGDPFTGRYSVVENPDGAVGEQVGCHNCGEPFSSDTAGRPCKPDPDVAP